MIRILKKFIFSKQYLLIKFILYKISSYLFIYFILYKLLELPFDAE